MWYFLSNQQNCLVDNLIPNIQDVLCKQCSKQARSLPFLKRFECNMLHSNDRPHATFVHATFVACNKSCIVYTRLKRAPHLCVNPPDIYVHRCRNRGGGGGRGSHGPPLFGLVSRVQVLVILHTRYAQKPAGVGGTSCLNGPLT